MHGVAAVPLPRSCSQIAVFGQDAVVVAAGLAPRAVHEPPLPVPIVAASGAGRGRLLALGHINFLHPALFGAPASDLPLLLANALLWLAGDAVVGVPTLTTVGFADGYVASLAALAPLIDVAPLPSLDPLALATCSPQDVHLLALPGSWPGFESADGVAGLERFVAAGGGVLIAYDRTIAGSDTPSHRPGAAAANAFRTPRYPANDFTAALGLVYTHQPVSVGSHVHTRSLVTALTQPQFAHVGAALDALNFLLDEGEPRAKLPPHVIDLIDYFAVYLPLEASLFAPALCAAVWDAVPAVTPSLARPVYKKDVVERLAVLVAAYEARASPAPVPLPAGSDMAPPSAAPFPGPVPVTAKPAARAVSITATAPGWFSTGLYAPPGGLVSVALVSAAEPFVDACGPELADAPQLLVRIGAHSDVLFGAAEWRRHPSVCCTGALALDGHATVMHNPYGGLVYVEVRDAGAGGAWASDDARLVFEIDGCIDAPYFRAGETSAAEWRAMHLHRPAPWGELASSRVIFTLPSALLRTVDDPAGVLAFWDRVVDTMEVLSQRVGGAGPLAGSRAGPGAAGRAGRRRRPERIVGDVQLASGTLHNGYPICCSLPSLLQDAMDVKKLKRKGAWALFKCLGYNFQASAVLDFDNMADVAVNLYPLFVFDSMLGVSPLSHPRLNAHEGEVMEFLFRGFDDPDVAPLWVRNPDAGAHMYVQLVVEFGWELFFGANDSYAKRPLAPADVAADPAALLRDQWIVRLSETARRDLCPFFKLWGVAASREASIATSRFVEWLPPFLSASNTLSTKVSHLARKRKVRTSTSGRRAGTAEH